MLAGLGQIELLTRLRGSWYPKSSRIHQKLGAGVCEDLQELGDPPEPEDSPEPELREEDGFDQARRQTLSRGWDILRTTRLPVDEDRGKRDMAEDAPENWLPEMEAARMKGDCRGKGDPQNESPSQEGHLNPTAKRHCQFQGWDPGDLPQEAWKKSTRFAGFPKPIERVH